MLHSRGIVALAVSILVVACARPHADAQVDGAASAQPTISPSAAGSSQQSYDPLAAVLGNGAEPPAGITDPDKNAVFDPTYVAVGDAFYVAASVSNFACEPRGEWSPPGVVTFLGEELIVPKFPTPARSYHAYYRATAKGDATLTLTCSRTKSDRPVAKRALKVVDAGEAVPFVAIDGEYFDLLAPTYEGARAGALACFAREFAGDPHVRGSGSFRPWADKKGVLTIARDPDEAKNFHGISPTTIDCVLLAVTNAAAAQKHVDVTRDSYTRENGVLAGARMRFEVRPKVVDLKTCDRYAEHWKTCPENIRDSSIFIDPHEAILARKKVITTDDGRSALAFACADAMRDLDEACHP